MATFTAITTTSQVTEDAASNTTTLASSPITPGGSPASATSAKARGQPAPGSSATSPR